jgi:MutS domain V
LECLGLVFARNWFAGVSPRVDVIGRGTAEALVDKPAPESISPVGEYRLRLSDRRERVRELDRRHLRFSHARLVIFLAGIGIAIGLGRSSGPWLLLAALIFAIVAFKHARLLNARDRAARAVSFYERGLARLEDRWAGTGETGDRFRSADHLYADDLDLFGPGSLFELLSTPRTSGGEAALAAWLTAPASPDEVRARQGAVVELSPRLDLREDLFVIGPEIRAAVDTDALLRWADRPAQLTATWPRIVFPLMALVSASLVAWWIWTGEAPAALLPTLILQTLLAVRFRHAVHEVAHGVDRREQELGVLAELLGRLERETVASPRLVALRNALTSTGHPPSWEIRRLARLVDWLSSRENPYFAPFSALLMLGSQLAFAVDRWRVRCGPAVAVWIEVLSEFETLTALANYSSEHPADPMPDLAEGEPKFDAERLNHPLIPVDRAVPNDVRLGRDAAHVWLVSGSNMSGKSTLLRTVGLNAVLAQAGAPVRAARLQMTPLAMGATLRIQDSLQAGRSRFYAEITRISSIVSMAKHTAQGTPGTPGTLFLLDEVLGGTNSHDRRQGAEAIVRGLVALGAIGLATTHDLALAALAERPEARAENVHFEDRFEDGQLHFDYRLRPGVVRTSNAIALMRSVGLDV